MSCWFAGGSGGRLAWPGAAPGSPAQAEASFLSEEPGTPRAASEHAEDAGEDEEQLEPWLEAAREFEMNADFDIRGAVEEEGGNLDLGRLMAVMKAESGGKRTIQALGDKILLGGLLRNMGVPQMPALFETYSEVDEGGVEEFVAGLEDRERDQDGQGSSRGAGGRDSAFDLVVKPTHLSSGTGALVLSAKAWKSGGYSAQKLAAHMEAFLAQRAADSESEALRSLVPGFIAQPRYRSCLDFGHPLEMRVVTLWGKARVGVWWWGRSSDASAGKPHRTAWLVRRPGAAGRAGGAEGWQPLHRHPGGNPGFQAALALFVRAMPAMAAAAEAVARAVGAPFLRSDFFVGSERWGVRLNEVAYGSGVDHCRLRRGGAAPHDLEDDGPAIARILQEGLELCRRRPPEHFLSRLGATGSSYEARAAWWHWWEPDGTAPAMRVGEAAEDAPCLEGGAARRMLSSSTSCCQRMNAHQCSTPRGVLTPWAAHAPRAAAGARPVVVAVPCGSGAVLPAPPWRQLPAKPVAAVTLRPRGQPWPARPGGA